MYILLSCHTDIVSRIVPSCYIMVAMFGYVYIEEWGHCIFHELIVVDQVHVQTHSFTVDLVLRPCIVEFTFLY